MKSQKGGQNEASENNLFEILTLRHQILENPESAEAHCDLGVAMIRNGDSENAIRYLKQATELNPKHDRSFFNLGRCYQTIGYIDNAINAYDRVIQLNPEDDQAWTNLAALFLQRNEADEAIRLYLKAVDLNPKVHETWVDLGTTQFLHGLYQDSVTSLKKAIELDDSNYHCWQQLGLCYYALKQTEDSIHGFEKALELNPGCHSTCNNLGNSYLQNQQPDQAESFYRKAIDLNSDISDYWFNLGELLFNLNRREESITCFSKVYQQDPSDQEALTYLVEAMLEVSPVEALPHLQTLIKTRGESPYLLSKLGDLYQKTGNKELEAKTRLKLSTSSPLDTENNLKLAKLTLAQGKKDLAYSFLKGSLPASAGDDQFWFSFSQSFRVENNPEEELNCLTAVVKANPDHHLAWLRLGSLALSKGMPANAYQYFQKALPILKNRCDIWTDLTRDLLKAVEFDLAVSSCFQLISLNRYTPEKWDYLFRLFKKADQAESFCQTLAQKILEEVTDPKLAVTFAKPVFTYASPQTAETFLRALGQKWPESLEIIQEQVEFLINTRQQERAEAIIDSVLSRETDNYQFLVYRAQIAFQKQEISGALEHLEKAKEIKPGHYLSWLVQAQIQLEEGNPDAALVQVEQSLALNPLNADIYKLLGAVQSKMKNFQEAAEAYRDALRQNRRDPEIWRELALIDQQEGATNTAKTKLLRSLACCKTYLPAWTDLAELFLQMGDEKREQSCREEIENLKSSARG